MLGEMGADVIKVGPLAGDPMRRLGPQRTSSLATHFVNFNRGKRSVTLDLIRLVIDTVSRQYSGEHLRFETSEVKVAGRLACSVG